MLQKTLHVPHCTHHTARTILHAPHHTHHTTCTTPHATHHTHHTTRTILHAPHHTHHTTCTTPHATHHTHHTTRTILHAPHHTHYTTSNTLPALPCEGNTATVTLYIFYSDISTGDSSHVNVTSGCILHCTSIDRLDLFLTLTLMATIYYPLTYRLDGAVIMSRVECS